MYQIGDTVQAYTSQIGRVIYTRQRTDPGFSGEQQVWIKCLDGKVLDAGSAYFKPMCADKSMQTD